MRSQQRARDSKGADKTIAPVWASVQAQGAPEVSKVQPEPSLTVEARERPNREVRMG